MNHYDLAKRIMRDHPYARARRADRVRRVLGNVGMALWGLLVLGANVGIVLVALHFVIKYW